VTDAIGAPLTRRTPTRTDSLLAVTRSDAPPAVSVPLSPSRPGRLRVDFLDAVGPSNKSLDLVADGTEVTATGSVTTIAVKGEKKSPRASVLLTGTNGESASCLIRTEHYVAVSGFLAEGQLVQVRGTVRRPLKDMPAVIETVEIREAGSRARGARGAVEVGEPQGPTVEGTGCLSLVAGAGAAVVAPDADEVRDALGDALASWYVAGLKAGWGSAPVMRITLEPIGAPEAPQRSFQVSAEQVADLTKKVGGSDAELTAVLRAVEGER
jgi:hypothetical protein